ncbi:MAG: transposase [Anaerolineaceae bacterium]
MERIMVNGKKLHHRRSIRLAGYDYASEGGYFITIITQKRMRLFGDIVNEVMRENDFGRMVREEWFNTSKIRSNIELLEDEFVIMPNHIHGIIWIMDRADGEVSQTTHSPVGAYSHTPLRSPSNTIGSIIRGFKGAVTTRINICRGRKGSPVWQRNYYDSSRKNCSGAQNSRHIINSERDYENIAEYIHTNPLAWQTDHEFVA